MNESKAIAVWARDAAGLVAAIGVLAVVGMGVVALQIYFMPVNAKLERIAKAKTRHGIPIDQPHHIDRILKSGFFRVP